MTVCMESYLSVPNCIILLSYISIVNPLDLILVSHFPHVFFVLLIMWDLQCAYIHSNARNFTECYSLMICATARIVCDLIVPTSPF